MKAVSFISICAAFFSVAWPVSAVGPGRKPLRGHVPAVVTHLQATGRLSASTRLPLAIGLPLRNRGALTNLLLGIYDPASTNHHRYLTPEQFTTMFGPTEQDYQTAIAFARANGMTVTGTHRNRMLLDVEAPAGDIERAFQVTMRRYPHPTEARPFYAPDVEPSVEQNLPILDVSGLSDYAVPRPLSRRTTPLDTTMTATPASGSAPGGAYMGNDFRAAYVPGVTLTGTGQAVGLLEFDGYYTNDITAYEQQAGLPNVTLKKVLLDRFKGNPGPYNDEVALDIEVVISLAPGLDQVILYEGVLPNSILNRMASDNLAKQLSSSWTWGLGSSPTTDQIFLQFAAQGQSFFQASGDSGAYTGVIDQPADNPYITIVGGTTLRTTGPGGAWSSEVTWSSSGGGISTHYPLPSWQNGIDLAAKHGSTTARNIPDVALVADNVWVHHDNGRSSAYAGTSIAAPLWAAFTALVNQQAAQQSQPPVGFLNPALYALGKSANYTTDFHDITSGNNTSASSPNDFFARSGYDLCTGWGTPNGQNLINALAGMRGTLTISPVTGFRSSGPVGGPFSTASESFSLTNSGTISVDWRLVNTSLWLQASPDHGSLAPGGPATTVTIALTAAASNLTAGVYTTTAQFTNLTSRLGEGRDFTLLVEPGLLQNGGFETGDFSGWTTSGNFDLNCEAVVAGSPNAHSGTFGAALGPPGTPGYLSQTLPTVAGQPYLLSFWVANVKGPTITIPNEFRVAWNTNASATNLVFDGLNLGAFDWTNMVFLVTAAGSSTVLQFGFRNDPSFFALDDVTVTPVTAPTFLSVAQTNGVLTCVWNAMTGLAYQLQHKTDFLAADWVNAGDPLTATGSVVVISLPLGPDPQRFYRVVLLP